MGENMEDIADVFTTIIEVLPEIMNAIELKSDEIIQPIERMVRKYWFEKAIPMMAEGYEKELKELMKRGFTRKEAMLLMLNTKIVLSDLIEKITDNGKNGKKK